jgi:hypothetical protein
MTPETLRIDRSFRGVGRIARATGTTDPGMRRKINRMLDALVDDGRLDIMRALRDGDLEFLQVYDAFRRRALHELPVAETMARIADAMKQWIESLLVPRDYSAKHVESLETSRRYFERADPKATLADLPRILEELRESLGRRHPRSFNLARSAAQTFVRSTLKKSHPLYLRVAAVEPRKLGKTTKRTPLTLDQMNAFFPSPDADWLDGIAWGMATTGMHAAEYWGRWNVLADRVHVDGTKRGGRVRDVPLVKAPAVPKYNRRKFEDDLRERTRAITVYDLRRTYANWMESAGIPRTRRRLYMGHGAKDVTDLYEHHEVAAFLAEDAAKLRGFLKLSPTEIHTMTLHKAEGA